MDPKRATPQAAASSSSSSPSKVVKITSPKLQLGRERTLAAREAEQYARNRKMTSPVIFRRKDHGSNESLLTSPTKRKERRSLGSMRLKGSKQIQHPASSRIEETSNSSISSNSSSSREIKRRSIGIDVIESNRMKLVHSGSLENRERESSLSPNTPPLWRQFWDVLDELEEERGSSSKGHQAQIQRVDSGVLDEVLEQSSLSGSYDANSSLYASGGITAQFLKQMEEKMRKALPKEQQEEQIPSEEPERTFVLEGFESSEDLKALTEATEDHEPRKGSPLGEDASENLMLANRCSLP